MNKMIKKPLLATLLFVMAWAPVQAETKIGETASTVFATVEEGQEILTQKDDFVQRLSPFDRASRMKTDKTISETEYLDFVRSNVLAWEDKDKEQVIKAIGTVNKALKEYPIPLPENVVFIKSSGEEEGNAAYTRANAIVLTKKELGGPLEELEHFVSHELFHVMSRANPELRDELYASIGFMPCEELEFPEALVARKITNPDAPKNNYCIELEVGGESQWMLPILLSTAEKYDVKKGGRFFDYLQLQMLSVERDEKTTAIKTIYEGKQPKLTDVEEVSGFFEKIGKNTGYIIHPEEVLAENFSMLLAGKDDLPSPEITKKMADILSKVESTESAKQTQ